MCYCGSCAGFVDPLNTPGVMVTMYYFYHTCIYINFILLIIESGRTEYSGHDYFNHTCKIREKIDYPLVANAACKI
jgi:hypothetical protein